MFVYACVGLCMDVINDYRPKIIMYTDRQELSCIRRRFSRSAWWPRRCRTRYSWRTTRYSRVPSSMTQNYLLTYLLIYLLTLHCRNTSVRLSKCRQVWHLWRRSRYSCDGGLGVESTCVVWSVEHPWVVRAGGVVKQSGQPAELDSVGELVLADRVPDARQPVGDQDEHEDEEYQDDRHTSLPVTDTTITTSSSTTLSLIHISEPTRPY